MFTMRNVIEQCTKWQRQLRISYVDLRRLWTASAERIYGVYMGHRIPQQIVRVIKSVYNNFKCREWETANPASL